MTSALQRAATAYAKFNLKVFPVGAGTKEPLTAHGYQDGTDDGEQVSAWWDRWPDANIGLACGPSGYIALDADPAKMDDAARELWAEWREQHPTSTQDTPAAGQHLLYTLPPDVTLSNSRGSLPPGIDIRVNGYILLAPSAVTYHGDEAAVKGVPDGHTGRYAWVDGLKPTQFPPQPLPDEILALLKTKPTPTPTVQAPPPTPAPAYTNGNDKAEPYARAALEKELDTLARTPQGERNEQLNRSAFSLGQLVAGGALPEAEVVQMLGDTALAIGLDEREIGATIASGMRAGAQSPRGVPEAPRLVFRNGAGGDPQRDDEKSTELHYKPEDGGILDVWLALYGEDWLYVNGYERWHHWTGNRWEPDEGQRINAEIQDLMQRLNDQAIAAKRAAGDNKVAVSVAQAYIGATKRSRGRVASVEGMAQAKRGIGAATLNGGNRLNLQNGVLNLDTLELEPHDRGQLMTYQLPYAYDPAATCPRFRRFIYEVLVEEGATDPDLDLIRLFQELVGYTITTETQHEVMVWLAGEGGNGKTVAITVLRELLGEMAGSVDFQTLGTTGNYDLADLPSKRLIFSTESKRGGHISEELLRRIVSGERINARPIYGKPFLFDPVAKIWWAMNDKPVIRDTSNATWRRLKLIPFNRTFAENERDIHLTGKLLAELPGILNWAVDGLARLRAQGRFSPAAAADAAASDYRRESNPIMQWLEECTGKSPEHLYPTRASAAYSNYKAWCENNGRTALNSTNFGTELKRAAVPSKRTNRGVHFDLVLNDD